MSREKRYYCMSRIRSKGTKPELAVRRHLFSLGYRFRVNVKTLPGHPDIVLPRYRTAIFVNGCFWHAHEGCRYNTRPSTNRLFWEEKRLRNRERDLEVIQLLEAMQWNVITLWECQLKPKCFNETMNGLILQIRENGKIWEKSEHERKVAKAEALEKSRMSRKKREAVEMELASKFNISRRRLRVVPDKNV